MKRGTPRHPKVGHLCELLGVRVPTAVGYLELLWHFAAEFAPQGDIGRYEDARIEAAVYWKGKRGSLVTALLQARFIDATPEYRLVIHDWHEHADDAVKKRLERGKLKFLSVIEKVTGQRQISADIGGQRPTSAENGCLPEPSLALPVPEPSPAPRISIPKAIAAPRVHVDDDAGIETPVSRFVEALYARHPKKKNLPLVQSTVVTMYEKWNGDAAEMMAEIARVHALWCDSDEWKKQNGRYAPPLDQWLVDRGWTKEPDVW